MYPELIPVKKALKIIDDVKTTPKKEEVSLEEAKSRVLAEPVPVLIDAPPFDRAAMDGYAVIAEDTKTASDSEPICLNVVSEIGAGSTYESVLRSGETVRISTGAQMPKGSDAVIMHEHVELSGNEIRVKSPTNTLEDLALQGEDLKKGEMILKAGQFLGPHHVSVIASAGHKTAEVLKKPEIGVIITGNELVDPSTDLKPGKIINSNKYALKGVVEDTLAIPHIIQCPDDIKILLKEIQDASRKYDAIITTGGTAKSKGDLIIDAIDKLGTVLIHGVSAKPGKPVGFGVVNDKPVFMLSGYPVAAAIQFDVFVRSYLLKMQNIRKKFPLTDCVAGDNIKSSPKKHNVIRANFKENKGTVYPIRTKSGINKSIVLSNCYIIVEEGRGYIKKGDKCKILKYSSLKVC